MDQERIKSKLNEIDEYLDKLENIIPENFEIYKTSIRDKLACERLLQLSIENIIDICNILVSKFRVGIPSDEDDVFEKLKQKNIITKEMKNILIGMKSVRNILVHRYGTIDDEKIFENISTQLGDFEKFKKEVLNIIKNKK